MGGCGVPEILLAYVRRLLLSIIPWGGHSPTGRVFLTMLSFHHMLELQKLLNNLPCTMIKIEL
jgi:hypothetical protein